MSERSSKHATFVIERVYDAAPARVFRAWADPAAKAQWFGPKERAGETTAFDFQVGGTEHFEVETPDGALYSYDALYQDIVPDTRIVYTYDMHRNADRISVSVTTVEFFDSDDGTRLTYTEQGVFLDGHDTAEQREHGTRELLGALDQALRQVSEAL
jgi:uncharacterized protein YndB with AHSA1/START domain